MPKKIIIILFALAGIAAVILGALLFINPKNNSLVPSKEEEISLSLEASSGQVNVGDKIVISVFAKGKEAERIRAYDLKINYDKETLKLISATPGEFFESYFKIKWDTEASRFAAMVNPNDVALPVNVLNPLIVLEFSALSSAQKSQIATNIESNILISGDKLIYPDSEEVSLNIQ